VEEQLAAGSWQLAANYRTRRQRAERLASRREQPGLNAARHAPCAMRQWQRASCGRTAGSWQLAANYRKRRQRAERLASRREQPGLNAARHAPCAMRQWQRASCGRTAGSWQQAAGSELQKKKAEGRAHSVSLKASRSERCAPCAMRYATTVYNVTSFPRALIERSAASSIFTTLRPATPSLNGSLPSFTHSMKYWHSAFRASIDSTFGAHMSPER
jgi:hypothetical protein